MKERCNYAYIGIAVSHFADRILEAVPTRAMASSFLWFLDHTQRGTTFDRIPLDKRSARSRDLYLKARNTHDKHPCPRRDSNPQSQQTYALGRPRTSDFSRCDNRAAQMKRTVLNGSARTGDCLIVAIEKSQRVPFPGRHDCRSAACTNEAH